MFPYERDGSSSIGSGKGRPVHQNPMLPKPCLQKCCFLAKSTIGFNSMQQNFEECLLLIIIAYSFGDESTAFRSRVDDCEFLFRRRAASPA